MPFAAKLRTAARLAISPGTRRKQRAHVPFLAANSELDDGDVDAFVAFVDRGEDGKPGDGQISIAELGGAIKDIRRAMAKNASKVQGSTVVNRLRTAVAESGVSVSEWFAKMDINAAGGPGGHYGDGSVSRKEFKSGIQHLIREIKRPHFTETELAILISYIDADDDGDLSLDEVRDGFAKAEKDSGADGRALDSFGRVLVEIERVMSERRWRIAELFQHMDGDGSGEISVAELRYALWGDAAAARRRATKPQADDAEERGGPLAAVEEKWAVARALPMDDIDEDLQGLYGQPRPQQPNKKQRKKKKRPASAPSARRGLTIVPAPGDVPASAAPASTPAKRHVGGLNRSLLDGYGADVADELNDLDRALASAVDMIGCGQMPLAPEAAVRAARQRALLRISKPPLRPKSANAASRKQREAKALLDKKRLLRQQALRSGKSLLPGIGATEVSAGMAVTFGPGTGKKSKKKKKGDIAVPPAHAAAAPASHARSPGLDTGSIGEVVLKSKKKVDAHHVDSPSQDRTDDEEGEPENLLSVQSSDGKDMFVFDAESDFFEMTDRTVFSFRDVDAFVRHIDSLGDGNGEIDQSEFEGMWRKLKRQLLSAKHAAQGARLLRRFKKAMQAAEMPVKEWFKMADSRHAPGTYKANGQVTKLEFRNGLDWLNKESPRYRVVGKDLTKLLRYVDTSGDALISENELVVSIAVASDVDAIKQHFLQSKLYKLFSRIEYFMKKRVWRVHDFYLGIDRDRSGVITTGEIRDALQRWGFFSRKETAAERHKRTRRTKFVEGVEDASWLRPGYRAPCRIFDLSPCDVNEDEKHEAEAAALLLTGPAADAEKTKHHKSETSSKGLLVVAEDDTPLSIHPRIAQLQAEAELIQREMNHCKRRMSEVFDNGGGVENMSPTKSPHKRRDLVTLDLPPDFSPLNYVRAKMWEYITIRQLRMHDLFAECDKDGDGVVTGVELSMLVRYKLGIEMSKAQIVEMMAEIDDNANGMIEYDEWMRDMKKADNIHMELIDKMAVAEGMAGFGMGKKKEEPAPASDASTVRSDYSADGLGAGAPGSMPRSPIRNEDLVAGPGAGGTSKAGGGTHNNKAAAAGGGGDGNLPAADGEPDIFAETLDFASVEKEIVWITSDWPDSVKREISTAYMKMRCALDVENGASLHIQRSWRGRVGRNRATRIVKRRRNRAARKIQLLFRRKLEARRVERERAATGIQARFRGGAERKRGEELRAQAAARRRAGGA